MPVEPKKSQSIIFIVALFVILSFITYFVYVSKMGKNSSAGLDNKVTQNITKENIVFKAVNVSSAKTESDKLPSGLSASIPVETKGIFLSDSKTYTDRSAPVTVYTVNYTTTKSVSEKYGEYLTYMTKNGFVFSTNGKDKINHVLNGTKDGNTLLVVVTSSGGKTVVQLSYTEVK